MLFGAFISMMFSISNIFNLLLVTELIWICIYVYSSLLSSYYDSLFIYLFALYLLGISTGESSLGLSLLMLKLAISGSFNLNDNLSIKNSYVSAKRLDNVINSFKNNV